MADIPVLIVGAGPSGLVLATTLSRQGVGFRIIDKHPGVLEATKSAALHARTLEHLRDLGVADAVLAEGRRVDILQLRTGYEDRLTTDFRVLDDTTTPYIMDIPQARTEHILIEALVDRGGRIERDTTLTGLVQGEDAVVATVTTPSGGTETITADWVVGCDGVRSTVRSLLELDFVGADYADDWVLCDAEVDWPLPRNEMTFSGDQEGIYGVFPLPGERRYRLAYTQSRDAEGRLIEPSLEDAQHAMRRTGVEGRVLTVDEFWTFNLAHKLATRFSSGRVFLVGDAGHVHTPFGGQGLNLGVGDAVNLGWKLADVITGRAPEALLDSYSDERRAVARVVVQFTHLGAQTMLLRADPRRHLREGAFAVLRHLRPARRKMARRLSQLSHTYASSPAVVDDTRHRRRNRVRAGDRLPDLAVFDGVTNTSVRLHDLLPTGAHSLLLVGDARVADVVTPLAGALRHWSIDPHVHVLTPDWRVAEQLRGAVPVLLDRGHQAARLYGDRPTAYLLRPDRHIGYAGPADAARIDRYLSLVALRIPEDDDRWREGHAGGDRADARAADTEHTDVLHSMVHGSSS